jgi:molecular chaperone Hsp33
MSPTDNASQRFLFDQADVRGETVRLGSALIDMFNAHPYSQAVRQLLGEFAAAATLISNNLKYAGRISLQARSTAALSLVMVECSSEREIRGVAQGDIDHHSEDLLDLIRGGQLALTIEREGGQRYQGIVALEGRSLSAILEAYFAQSEQLRARFWLASDGDHSAGLMLQELPAQIHAAAEREETWSTLCALAETLQPPDLLGLASQELLFRLYHDQMIRVFPAEQVVFKCRCNRARSASTLALLPEEERAEIIAEQGCISLTCELCGTTYRFDHINPDPERSSSTLH